MKIDKLKITGFGKFKNREIDLTAGLNLVFGNNEAGKSTIQNFIKAVFYGFPTQKTDGEGRPPEKSIYKPWDGSDYRGTVELTDDNMNKIRIERDFGNNDASVYDSNLTDISSEFEYASRQGLLIGEKLLSMDRSCFLNTVFIKQGETAVNQADRNHIFEKMVNLVNTGTRDESTVESINAISKTLRKLGNTRTSGRIYNKTADELAKATDKIGAAIEENRRMSDNIIRKTELEQEMTEIDGKINNAEKNAEERKSRDGIAELENTKRRYNYLKSEISRLDNEIRAAKNQMVSLNAKNKSEDDVLSYLKKAASASEKIKRIPPGNHRDSIDCLRKRERNVKALKVILLAISVLTIPAGIFLTPYSFIATGLFLVFLTFLMLKKSGYSIEQLEEFVSLSDECSNYLSEINEFLLSSGKQTSSSFEVAETKLNELFKEINKKTELENQITNNESGKKGQESLANEILGSFNSINELDGKIDELKTKLESIGKTSEIPEDSLENLKKEYDRIRQEHAGTQRLVSEYVHGDTDIAELEEKLDTVRGRMNDITVEREALEKAKDLINTAADDLRGNIFPEVNDKMGKFISRITGGRHSNLMAGLGKSMNTEFNDSARTIWNFSDGTIEQMYLALRLSAAEILSKGESLPIMIDEAFAYYDENRIRAAFELLEESSKERQIIIFTCKESELSLAKELGNVNIIEI